MVVEYARDDAGRLLITWSVGRSPCRRSPALVTLCNLNESLPRSHDDALGGPHPRWRWCGRDTTGAYRVDVGIVAIRESGLVVTSSVTPRPEYRKVGVVLLPAILDFGREPAPFLYFGVALELATNAKDQSCVHLLWN